MQVDDVVTFENSIWSIHVYVAYFFGFSWIWSLQHTKPESVVIFADHSIIRVRKDWYWWKVLLSVRMHNLVASPAFQNSKALFLSSLSLLDVMFGVHPWMLMFSVILKLHSRVLSRWVLPCWQVEGSGARDVTIRFWLSPSSAPSWPLVEPGEQSGLDFLFAKPLYLRTASRSSRRRTL